MFKWVIFVKHDLTIHKSDVFTHVLRLIWQIRQSSNSACQHRKTFRSVLVVSKFCQHHLMFKIIKQYKLDERVRALMYFSILAQYTQYQNGTVFWLCRREFRKTPEVCPLLQWTKLVKSNPILSRYLRTSHLVSLCRLRNFSLK